MIKANIIIRMNISIRMMLVFLFLSVSINTFAYDVEIDGIYYNLNTNNKTAEVTYNKVFGENYSGVVVIPEKINVNGSDYIVTSIDSFTFNGSNNLKSVTIPKSITSLGVSPFSSCQNLESIVVEVGNQYYDSRDNCNAIIKTSTNELLVGCKGTIIPSTVTSIKFYAFEGSNISKIIIPNSIKSIGDAAFRKCKMLVEVVSYINPPYAIDTSVFDGISSDAILTVPQGTKNSYSLFSGWTSHFKEIVETGAIFIGKIYYSIESEARKTIHVTKGDYGTVLEVPEKVNYMNEEWTITGVDNGSLVDNIDLAAIIWNPDVAFTESVDNPNLLLYVKSASYAPASIKNVIVNGAANNITLSDAVSKNDFYCPREFTAQKINYTHHYKMETGLGSARGWETIALPFDVQKVTHQSKGEIVPFANWKSGDAKKPFWLMTYGNSGWTEANSIKANTPYIISMPNHSYYKSEFQLNGNVTFIAENVTIPTTENINTINYNGRTFVPNYKNQSDNSYYTLNVNNDYETYSGSDVEGSKFFIGLRAVHPFEAYMTSASQTRSYIAIDDDMTTGIGDITEILTDEKTVRVYNLNGQLIMSEENKSIDEIQSLLSVGVYIVNGKKLVIK